jgi:hypothetical protein
MHARTACGIADRRIVTGFAEVSEILWRERELLDMLLFKLESEQLLLKTGDVRWLSRATREIELVLEQLRLTELTRALEIAALVTSLHLPPDPTLATLAEVAPSPWGDLFRAHRAAFVSLVAEVTDFAEANRQALEEACRTTEERLIALGAEELAGFGFPRQVASWDRQSS